MFKNSGFAQDLSSWNDKLNPYITIDRDTRARINISQMQFAFHNDFYNNAQDPVYYNHVPFNRGHSQNWSNTTMFTKSDGCTDRIFRDNARYWKTNCAPWRMRDTIYLINARVRYIFFNTWNELVKNIQNHGGQTPFAQTYGVWVQVISGHSEQL